MTLRDLTALTVKISGLVLFVLLVARLPEYLKSYIADGGNEGFYIFWVYFLPLVIPGIVALLLFNFPYSIANRIITTPADQNGAEFDLAGIELILIRLLGLLLFYFALSDLVFHLTNFYYLSSDINGFTIEAYNYAYLVATVAEFVFAFWLLAGTGSVVRFVQKLRHR